MISRVEGGQDGMKFKCLTCDKRTTNKQSMTRHVETHLDMEHSCHLCGKVSKTRVGLAQHYAKFHGDTVQSPWALGH